MAARIQGFPGNWQFMGGKTAAYRQIGNAFFPLVAKAMGCAIRAALENKNISYPSDGRLIQGGLLGRRLLDQPKKYKAVCLKKASKH